MQDTVLMTKLMDLRKSGMTYNEISQETGVPLDKVNAFFKGTEYEFIYGW